MQQAHSRLLTASQMQQVDANAVAQGINSYSLMCAAGKAVGEVTVEVLHALIDERSADCSNDTLVTASNMQFSREAPRILVVAGPGNNGGDGAITATELSALGFKVSVLRFVAPPQSNTCLTDAEQAFSKWQGHVQEKLLSEAILDKACLQLINQADVIIDALFGAGLSRPLEGELAALVNCINDSSALVIAVDIPSGLNGNTHQVNGACIRADVTITFYRYKPAHFLYPGAALCGRKRLMQIGLSDAQLNVDWPVCLLNEPTAFLQHLPVPSTSGHKFDRGHVLVRSGPLASTGAARLSAQTALECGSGLVTLSSDLAALPVNAAHLTAVMIKVCEGASEWRSLLQDSRITTVVVGPGNGIDVNTRKAVEYSLEANKHCILDADALSCWSTEADSQHLFRLLATCRNTAVLTPHGGEFARLFPALHAQSGLSKLDLALSAAKFASAVIVLKGADTVIASPDGRSAINASAPPWLATAGAGDVLAGLIASLVAQGMPAFEAACAAVWMHGEAALQLGYPMSAERLILQLPSVLNGLCSEALPQHILPIGGKGGSWR